MGEASDIYIDGKLVPLQQILDFLEGNDDAIPESGVNVTILPPINATGDITDEDSGEEDYAVIDNLPSSQLNAPAIICIKGNDNEDFFPTPQTSSPPRQEQSSSTEGSSGNIKPSSTPISPSVEQNIRGQKRKKKLDSSPQKEYSQSARVKLANKKKPDYKWVNNSCNIRLLEEEWPVFQGPKNWLTPAEYFELFFDDKIYSLVLNFTNNYANQKNKAADITSEELKSFVAVLLLSGYLSAARKSMYWEKASDTHNSLVSDAISRNRFQHIMSHIHVCANSNLDKKDRFAKIRPLLEEINKRCLLFMPHEQDHSVDESMVPYFGGHGTKQFIRGKPIRYGYKFWCGGPSSGYISWLEPYQGAGTLPAKYCSNGLGYGVIMSYVDLLPNYPYRLFFYNFFNSCEVLCELKKQGISATGTFRANRLGKSCPLKVGEMKETPRGHYRFCQGKNSSADDFMILTWNDNNIVTFGTNYDSITPMHSVPRYSQEKKKKITITQPHLIFNYNKKMGGVDRADQNISIYRVKIRGKKWYFPIIAHLIDVAEHNAWQLYRKDGGTMDHLSFRRRIVTSYLESNKRISSSKGRPSKISKIDSRYDKIEHWM